MLKDPSTIDDFDDFGLWIDVVVDDVWHQASPTCSDSELITMVLVGACRGGDVETVLVSQWHDRHDLFPQVSKRSCFNWRRRNRMYAIDTLRALVVPLKVITKQQTIFGYKLHVLVTLHGSILDFILAPAHQSDVLVGQALLLSHRDLIVLGDKGYISARRARILAEVTGMVLLTILRQNQERQVPPSPKRALSKDL